MFGLAELLGGLGPKPFGLVELCK